MLVSLWVYALIFYDFSFISNVFINFHEYANTIINTLYR